MELTPYISFAFGALLKIYDDIVDIPEIAIYATPQLMEIIKVLMIACFTYVSVYNKLHFVFIITLANVIHGLFQDNDALDTDFYRAGSLLGIILTLLTFSLTNLNMMLIVTFVITMAWGTFDHKLFPEEYSWKKIISRFIITIITIILFITNCHIVDHDLMMLGVGYLSVSVIIMIYAELRSNKTDDTRKY